MEVNGRRFQVAVYGLGQSAPSAQRPSKPKLTSVGPGGRGSGNTLSSPLQGNVIRVTVEEGQAVRSGDLICVIEAMKMENEISAHRDGTVRKLFISAGQPVAAGAPLIEIS